MGKERIPTDEKVIEALRRKQERDGAIEKEPFNKGDLDKAVEETRKHLWVDGD